MRLPIPTGSIAPTAPQPEGHPTSELEELFAFQLRAARVEAPEREYRFSPPRRWRFDFAWSTRRLALEIDGGTWSGGRHNRPRGYEADCEKANEALLLGWRVLRVTGAMVEDGRALDYLERALEASYEPARILRRSDPPELEL